MYEVTIDLYRDWIETVKEVFRGSGHPLPDEWTNTEIAEEYYRQSWPEEEVPKLAAANEHRLLGLQRTIESHLDSVIVRDIRTRTGYEGNRFKFRWMYQQGEHIIEEYSKYRIPIGPSPEPN